MYYNNSEYPPSTGTAFGVTDTIANFVDCYFWWYFSIVSVILFVVFTMTWPTKWNLLVVFITRISLDVNILFLDIGLYRVDYLENFYPHKRFYKIKTIRMTSKSAINRF